MNNSMTFTFENKQTQEVELLTLSKQEIQNALEEVLYVKFRSMSKPVGEVNGNVDECLKAFRLKEIKQPIGNARTQFKTRNVLDLQDSQLTDNSAIVGNISAKILLAKSNVKLISKLIVKAYDDIRENDDLKLFREFTRFGREFGFTVCSLHSKSEQEQQYWAERLLIVLAKVYPLEGVPEHFKAPVNSTLHSDAVQLLKLTKAE